MIAVLLIGDELLAGHVEDQNLKYVMKTFSITGHKLGEVRIVADEPNQISRAIQDLSSHHTYVITSGGVGPTHDDVTVQSIANAFNQSLIRHPELEKSLRDFYKESITEEALTMADIPVNSELMDQDGKNWPILRVENCYVLPGVPQFFRQKFDRLVPYLPKVDRYYIAKIFVKSDESYFAAQLTDINNRYEKIILGSYPIFGDPTYNTEITIKNSDVDLVQEVYDLLVQFFKENQLFCFSQEPKQT